MFDRRGENFGSRPRTEKGAGREMHDQTPGGRDIGRDGADHSRIHEEPGERGGPQTPYAVAWTALSRSSLSPVNVYATIEAPAEISGTLMPLSATARNTRAATPWAYPRPSPTKLISDTGGSPSIRATRPNGRRAAAFFARLNASASTRSAMHVCDVAALYTFVPALVRAVP